MSSAARIEELQKKFDENPRRYFAPLANECRKAGDLDAAIAICRAHLPQQPGHMSGHIVYGQALFESGELAEARSVFETALGLDPENLIALRHMGDIAAREGDLASARQWYSRVLETDPRNEEIQALVAGVDGTVAAPDDEIGSPFGGTGQLDDGVTTEFPAVSPQPHDASAEGVPRVRGGLPTLVDPALLAAAANAVPDGEAVAAEEEGVGELGLLDLVDETFAVPPLVTTEAEAATGAETSRDELLEPTAFQFDAADVDAGPMDGLEAMAFEAPSADETATFPRVGDEALLDSVDTPPPAQLEGLEGAEFDSSGFGGSGLETLAAPSFEYEPADAGPMQDPPVAPTTGEAFVTETMAELYLRQGYREEALGVYRKLVHQSPDDDALRARMERLESELAPAGDTGFPELGDAMAADGDDLAGDGTGLPENGDDIVAGLPRAIEPALVAAAADSQPQATHSVPASAVNNGPTIREFLMALASGMPAPEHRPSEFADTGYPGHANEPSTQGEIAEMVDFAEFDLAAPGGEAADMVDSGELDVASAAGADPVSGADGRPTGLGADEGSALSAARDGDASRGAGLDALFGGTGDPEDARAADALAAAYMPAPAEDERAEPAAPSADPLRGRPARPAGNDLSLDHVFGAPRQAGAPRNTGSFSFDQFFADGAVKPVRDAAPEQPANPGDEEDLEQFNSWLKDLRKQ